MGKRRSEDMEYIAKHLRMSRSNDIHLHAGLLFESVAFRLSVVCVFAQSPCVGPQVHTVCVQTVGSLSVLGNPWVMW